VNSLPLEYILMHMTCEIIPVELPVHKETILLLVFDFFKKRKFVAADTI